MRPIEAGRRNGSRYDRILDHVISVQHKLAAQSKNDALRSIVDTQADLTRQVTSAYSTARKLIS